MALEVVHGDARNRHLARELADELKKHVGDGTVYLGYPVLATADARVDVDALLVSPSCGLVAFLIADDLPEDDADWDAFVSEQDRLYGVLESQLGRHEELRDRRSLAVRIETVTVFPTLAQGPPGNPAGHYLPMSEVGQAVAEFGGLTNELYHALQAALQRVTTIKPAKRRKGVQGTQTRGAILKSIEKGIANLDRWQKKAAIESPEGPQRIRGLAGSGKTVVLALKAAYLHSRNPEWNVVLTFQSRSLYQQLEDLVTRFSFEHSNDKPDFDRLRILHAWGSASRPGVYYEIAKAMGATPRDFNYARATFGMDDALRGICAELLTIAASGDYEPIFDAVLIDEAQDLPAEFFQLVYKFTRSPKRIVWAYDELQKLNEAAMPALGELFGVNSLGENNVSLDVGDDDAARDVLLPVCYRNSPWSIATAHALGFGIYRKGGLVQHFDEPRLWKEIGYAVDSGVLELGKKVDLERSPSSYPEYFPQLLKPDDSVVLKSFADELEQDAWVANEIIKNLDDDEIEHDDILIVLPNTYTSKRRGARLANVLARHGVDSHLVGVSTSADEVFVRGSVAIAHIYRAKGNEAPMVYVLDSQYAVQAHNAITRRNILFTAITRSRAWVRICGFGDGMTDVVSEVGKVQAADYHLRFRIPTADQLQQLRRVNRERSKSELDALEKATRSAQLLLEAFDNGELDLDDLPPKVRTRLVQRMRRTDDDDLHD